MEEMDQQREEELLEREEEATVFTLIDEEGGEHVFEVIGTFAIEEREYIAGLPYGGDPENDEVVLCRLGADENGFAQVSPIPDDAEYEEAVQTFLDVFNADDEEVDITAQLYGSEEERAAGIEASLEEESEEDYCYQDSDGRLFIYDSETGEKVYLDENGEEIR